MSTTDYGYNDMIDLIPEKPVKYYPKIHCSEHGWQRHLHGEGCIKCLDEYMAKLDRAWPRGCPSGYGENSKE